MRYRTYPRADHESALEGASPDVIAWLRGRLAGRPAPQTCRV